jgi:ribonuclease D
MSFQGHQTVHKNSSRYKKMTREDINELPLQRYEGPISFIRSAEDIPAMLDDLNQETVLGFDIEIRPAFKKGQSYPPALLQLACSNTVYILQLKKTGISPGVINLLANKAITKSGVSIHFDVLKLLEICTFEPHSFVDLAVPAKTAGLKNFGLRGLAAALLGIRIPKGAQRTNWAQDDLTDNQIRYAATDAWAGREIYLEMVRKKIINHSGG